MEAPIAICIESISIMTTIDNENRSELQRCLNSPAYFMNKYVTVRDPQGRPIGINPVTDEQIKCLEEMEAYWNVVKTRYFIIGPPNSFISRFKTFTQQKS